MPHSYPAPGPLPAHQDGYAPPAATRVLKPPARKKKRRSRPLEVALLAVSLALTILMACFVFILFSFGKGLQSWVSSPRRNNTPPANSFAVISVVGTIQNAGGGAFGAGEPSYKHSATVSYIRQLSENSDNKGIFLYMNTGGGGVYESDEVYRALMAYKEATGRPVWAYMGPTCASGGYYICAAADHISANYNTTTGSIGVYIQLTDTNGLYEKIGVRTVLVKSGENKGIGVAGVEITDAQRAVYQSMVDESYQRFVTLVAEGRGLPQNTVLQLADGRPYTANQALANGLVDELGTYEDALAAFAEHTGATAFAPNFSTQTKLGSLLGQLEETLPKSEGQALLDFADTLPDGVPLAYAPGLEW